MSMGHPSNGGILVIEDDPDIRDTLAEILEDEGHSVRRAVSGADALQTLSAGPLPQLILLDLMMPVMDGWEFRRRQQADALLASIPVVVVSGDGNVADKAASLEAVAYLSKPIDLERLLALVARFCGGGATAV